MKARKTLKHQMKKLLLKKQFYMIDQQYKQLDGKAQTSENLIKILSRCIKMYDAQQEICKILMLIHTRLERYSEMRKELRTFCEMKKVKNEHQFDHSRMKKLYIDLVKLSCRINVNIRTLRDIEKCMNRPFMFNGMNYDIDTLHL